MKGGFFPSVYGNIVNATILSPLVARQAYRLWGSRKRITKKGRKGRKNKTRKNLRPFA